MSEHTIHETEAHLRTLGRASDAGTLEPAAAAEIIEWRPGLGRTPEVPTAAAPEQSFRDPKGYSAADYESAAAELAQEGRADLAAQARTQAEAVRQAETAAQQQAFARQWQEHVAAETARTPELQDAASPLSQAVQEILRETPVFNQVPEGFQHAVAIARAHGQASLLPTLEARVEALTRENQRLARLTSIPGSPPARSRHGEEPDLSERELRRMARDFDAELSN